MVVSRRSAGNRSSCQIRHMSANNLSRRVLLPTLYTSAGIPSALTEATDYSTNTSTTVVWIITQYDIQDSSHVLHNHVSSVPRCCWLGGRKGILPVKTDWWNAGMVMCLGRGADLHMAQLMPLLLTISCSSKSRLVLPSWFYLSGAGSSG